MALSELAKMSGQRQITVEFLDNLSIEQTVIEISQLSTPQVIVWYIGPYGLKKTGVQFYKDCLISPILKKNMQAIFWLVDLTAWGAFQDTRRSIHDANTCSDSIEKLSLNQIKCVRSAAIFKRMQEIADKDLLSYFRKALRRSFIHYPSKNFPQKNIRIRDIFSDGCPIMVEWYDQDVSKAYSVFQYLEGCLLIDEIFTSLVRTELLNDLQIVFALPNDELKYYKDQSSSFQKDVTFLVSKHCENLHIENINLQIKFLAFRYSTQIQHRPYNAPGKMVKLTNLSYEDLVEDPKGIYSSPPRPTYAPRQ